MSNLFAIGAAAAALSLAFPVWADVEGPQQPSPATTKAGKAAYIVRMALDPVATYDGSIPNLHATKPGKGQKINSKSAHVKQYAKFLEKSHDKVLTDAGASTASKLHDYRMRSMALPRC